MVYHLLVGCTAWWVKSLERCLDPSHIGSVHEEGQIGRWVEPWVSGSPRMTYYIYIWQCIYIHTYIMDVVYKYFKCNLVQPSGICLKKLYKHVWNWVKHCDGLHPDVSWLAVLGNHYIISVYMISLWDSSQTASTNCTYKRCLLGKWLSSPCGVTLLWNKLTVCELENDPFSSMIYRKWWFSIANY